MIVDAQLRFSNGQAVSADAYSTNVIDLEAAGRDIAVGEPMSIVIIPTVAADVADGDETYEFELHTDDNAAMSSSTELLARAIPRAALTAGSIHEIPIPKGLAFERYIAVRYDVGGTTPSITVKTFLMPSKDVQAWKAYADAITWA